jgi:hypothetical protein
MPKIMGVLVQNVLRITVETGEFCFAHVDLLNYAHLTHLNW